MTLDYNYNEIVKKLAFSCEKICKIVNTNSATHYIHDDLLPQKICGECRNQIINCFNFKMLCENTDYTLRDIDSDQSIENETADTINIADEPPDAKATEDVDFVDKPLGNCKDETSSSYECSHCLKKFRSLDVLNRHNAKHHQNKPYRCTTGGCRRSFVSSTALQVHSDVNHAPAGVAYTCRACGRTYRHARSLRQHLITHSKPDRFSCQHCQKGFTLRHHLTAHERTHSKEKPFLCQQCAACFATKERLQVHIKRHGGRREHCCLICNKSFISSYDLKMHVNVHSNERAYMCAECGRQFRSKRSLVRHTAKHVDPSINPDTLSSKNKVPEYPCDICKRNLPNSATMDKHMRTHLSGERSFKCETCSWMFTRASHLRAHISRRHAEVVVHTTSKSEKCWRKRVTDTIIMSADGSVDRAGGFRAEGVDASLSTIPSSAIDVINIQVIRKPDLCSGH